MTDNPKSTFAKRVRAARPRARRYDGWDDVISGLGLRVATSGHRSFFLRRTVRGRGLVILVYELTSCRGHARSAVPGSAGILPA